MLATGSALGAAGFTPAIYDLSAVPPYKPQQMALGVVRIYGTPLESLVGRWAYEFRAKQGQQDVVRDGAYLPPPLATVKAELTKLDSKERPPELEPLEE